MDEYNLGSITTGTLMERLYQAHCDSQPSGDEHQYDCGMQDYFAEQREEAGQYKDAILKELKARNINFKQIIGE